MLTKKDGSTIAFFTPNPAACFHFHDVKELGVLTQEEVEKLTQRFHEKYDPKPQTGYLGRKFSKVASYLGLRRDSTNLSTSANLNEFPEELVLI